MKNYDIPFSPPDISQSEIDNVMDVLRSGWITSGPYVKKFEEKICSYINCSDTVAVASATAAMELILKIFDIKKGDEIITTPYTYASTSNVMVHRGIMPTFVDTDKDSFLISAENIKKAITKNTKAIYTVDFAGVPVDYDEIKNMLKEIQREDILLVSDSAHSFGATYKGKKVGTQFHFHAFSFHAVKNLTTAEGGAITYDNDNLSYKGDLYRDLKIFSLNGQTKDAFSKTKAGAWEYDIITDGFKCNMTDIQGAIGVAQLQRYEGILQHRRKIFSIYDSILGKEDFAILPFSKNEIKETSYHLYPLRIKGFDEEKRNRLVEMLADMGIATNVHFIPLPMFTLYKNLGYNISNYPNAYNQYATEISLPVYSILSLENAEIIANEVVNCVKEILK
ncbi:dTDP-4-amino-4,6-dideoxygalactose transaminase [Hathewaya proteolytica DSM 3090]|uniref:dTDP-4-amino-4,6-dideoxygalactose transaminase n=1 Tax=Hathewaya proteolytica DSM 3090 TaxID=1121331 RepID=A0A1M6Q861_9CLOT|nr:DegT/DnrJ/EryC1/StrS aminotransferase family protein [Hathewaya proteolytica]SHK16459.1 dTDP-4-amino-4,6-dideoxygalactose transaminase [Hathewaya proteolytica DSM 3090]